MKKQKALFMLFVMLMGIVTQFSSSILTIQAFAAENETEIIEEKQISETKEVTNYSTGQNIVDYDKNNILPVDSEGNKTILTLDRMEVKGTDGTYHELSEDRPLSRGETFYIHYRFKIPDEISSQIKEGDYFEFDLPKSDFMELKENANGDLINDANTQTYGRFEARKGGHVTLFFDDNTASGKGYKDVEGRLFFDMTLEAKTIEIPGGVEVAIPNVSNDSSSIIWVDGRYKNYIEKELVSTENDIPLWKIIINPSSHKINNLNLTDKTLYNSAIHGADTNAAESIEITEIKEAQVFMNGDIKEGNSLPINQPNVDISSGHLDIGLSTIDRPYVVYLKTPLLYSVSGLVTNEITLNGTRDSGANVSGFARASYTRFSGFDVISKKAGEYDQKNQIMNWEITFNPNGLHIPQKDAKFTDTLKNGEYKEDSMTVDPNLSHHVEPTSNGFNFQFNEDVNEPVVIKYQVYVPDTKQKTTGNKVTSGEQTVDVSHKLPEGTVDPDPDPGNKDESTVTKKAYKSNGVPGAMWDIFINNEEKDLDWWEITDQLSISGDDTGYIEIDSFLLEDVTGNKHIVDPSEYDIEWNYKEPGVVSNRGTGFKLKYNKPTNHKFQISYKTVIKNGSKQSNSAFYKYSMKNEEKTDSATAEVGALVAAELKMSKSGHYIPQSNEVEWTVFVNEKSTNHMDLDNLFRDPMPDGQTYVEGSAKAYTGSGEYFRDDNSAKIEFKNNELRITNMEPTAGEKIVFRTKLDNPLAPYGKDGVHNTAYYQDFQQKEISASASLTVENAVNNFIRKSGKINENSPDLIDWKVDINPNGHHLSNVHIYDDSWENQIVQRESIKITNMFGHVLLEGPDKNTGDYVLDYTERQFHISMNHDVTEHLLLTYQGRVTYPSDVRPNEQLNITNDVRIKADYLFTTDKPISVTVEKQVPGSGGVIVGKKASLVVEKYDHQNKNDKLAGAEFSLYRGRKIDKNKLVDRAVTDSNGRAEFDDLSPDTYLLVETKAPNGYQISPEMANGRELEVNGSVSTTAFEEVANSKDGTPVDPETFIDIPVEKKWKDVPNNTTTPEVRVRLFANNVEKDSMVLKESNNYRGVFTHLPEKENNNKINYEVREDKVEGYKTITSGNNNGWEVVNTYIPETKPDEEVVNHFVNKKWENDKEEYRPKEIEVQLYRYIGNEKETPYLDTVKLHKGNNWAHSFTELPKYKEGTKETYTYLAKEVGVPEGYEQKLIGDADYTTIVNSYVNQETELISKSGKKTWSGDNKDNRPTSLEIQLLQDGVVYRSMITTADKDWAYTFDNLPKDDGDGHEYSYRVKEANVPNGYTSTVNGMDITNTYIPPKEELIDHLVRKDWVNDTEASRPSEIEVQLYRFYKEGNESGVDILEPVKLGPENGWQYTFKNLPKYEPVTNREYDYGAYEIDLPDGYTSEASGNTLYTIIKNTYQGPELISKSGKKTWSGDKEENRPSSIDVELLQDNQVYRRTVVTSENNWSYTFNDLPKDDGKGHTYEYKVKEANVPSGYTSEIDGMDIKNSYEPPKIELVDHLVRKEWQNDYDFTRPNEIKIQLYSYIRYGDEPGVDILAPVTLSPANGWMYTFKNLPKYEEGTGREYSYGAYELDPSEDYEDYTWGDPTYTIIRNTYTGPELISKSGEKTWENDGKGDYRPEIIEIKLLQDGKEYRKTSTSEEQDWEYTFENLPKDDGNGHVYEYKVKEVNVPTGYESISNGMNITNRVTTVEITGQKTWSDNNNAFKKRPNDIKMYLLQDGKRLKDSKNEDIFAIANQSTNWKYQFTDLPEYNFEEKTKYKYTVEEVSVPNYETVQNGYNINNIYQNKSKVQVTGQKTWDHGTNEISRRPDAVTVQLLQNNVPMANKKQTITKEDDWKYQFTDLQEFDDFANKYVYTVKEIGMTVKGKDVSSDYVSAVTGTDIHNTFDKPVKTSITGEKIWDDYNNKFNTRPTSIQVELMKKDNETNQVISTGKKQEVVANDKGYWTYTFTNLDKFDTNGKEVIYSVKEVKDSSLDKYETSVNGNNIYNTYVNTDKVKVDVNKKWFDYNHKELDKAPEEKIKVTLMQDGKIDFDYKGDKVVELNSNNKWQHTFTDLPRYDNNGDLYEYKVIEEGITGYETDYDISVDKGNGNTAIVINNTEPKPETTIISGIKIWDDHNDVAKLRPGKVEIELLRNGQSFSEEKGKTKTTTETSAKDNWEYSFTDLLLKDEIVNNESIINKYRDNKRINFSGHKSWEFDQHVLENRPEFLKISLIRDGLEVVETTLTNADTNWEYVFTNEGHGHPVYREDGSVYVYSLKEEAVDSEGNQVSGLEHYESNITSPIGDMTTDNTVEININNSYVHTETTGVSGSKRWNDADNKFGIRPKELMVTLYANGEATEKVAILNEANNWSYSFTNLPVYDDKGEPITYHVEEPKEIPGYTQVQGGPDFINQADALDETTEIKGTKKWNDVDNKLGKRPEKVTIMLYRNNVPVVVNKKILTATASEETNWEYEFKDLKKYDGKGNAYNYSVKEVPVRGYDSKVDDYDITNTYDNSEKIVVAGEKIWQGDQGNKLDTRPSYITVELYQLTKDQTEIANNQKPYQTKRVIPDNKGNWTYRFTDLDKYDDNLDEYQYVVREVKVLHYDPTIGEAPDYQITNTYKNDDVTKFAGKKEWQDNGNKLNTRPKDGITINLYQLTKGQTEITENQEIFATQVVKGSDTAETWEYEFKNLPKYDNNLDPFVYVAREEKIPGYETELTTINGKIITNIYQNIDTTSIKGEKKWVGDFDNKIKSRPTKIEVNLFQNGGENPYKTQTVKPDKKGNWTYEFKDLPKYDANLDEYIYTVTETKVPGYSTDYEEKESTINIINTYINDQTIDIPVMKKWQGDLDNHLNTRPDFITVELYQNDQLMENGTQNIKPDADGNWSYTYKDLPKYDQELNEYEYLVKEKPVSDYMTTVEQANKNEFVITNSFEGATTIDISGEKSWVDVDEANRPDSIKIQLQRSLDKEITEATSWENVGEVIEIKPDKKGNWEYTFVGQEIVDDKGNYYQYRVVEIGDDGKINTTITGKNDTVYQPTTTDWDIVNTQKQRKINIPVVKEWDEPNNNLRPESITITLYRDGVEVKKEIVTGDQKDNTWHHTFKDLDEFNPETMEKYVYTVKEDVVKHYDTTVIGDSSNGFTITNKSNPTTEVEVEGEKTWADSNDGFNKRPEKIKVHLLQDGQPFKEQEVVAPKWTYKFTGLPEYNPKTLTKYIYTVKEELPTDIMATDDQAGYLPNYLGHDINNEFQNTETTQVKGQKYWNHGTNALESRPTTVTIQLLQNGNPMVVGGKLNQVSVTEKDNWQYEFKDLPKFDEMGTAYIYTVEEIGVPSDYESTVSGMDVTNTFTKPVKTSVSGEKTWIDYQDKFNLRPEKITVNLMKEVKDGEGHILNEKVASQEVVGETWTYLFDDLFKYDEDGLEIKYSVEEVAVPEYETIIEGTNITNTYVNKETTKISVVKKWDDTDDKDKERPESIRVQLLVNGDYDLDDDGEVDQSVVLSDNNQWSHTFEELPKYDNNGEEIDYMVVEEGISDYITTYDINPATETREKQIIITNKKAKYQETAISGLKIWDDYGNAHNSRPDDITIKLLQDGKPMLDENGQEITTTINSSNNVDNNTWSYSFEGLPKHRDDGTAFVYTVEEVTVEHYTTKQKKNSTNITNTYRSDEMLKIKVQKTWDHSKNQLEKRPEAIKVYLKQDGKTIEETVLDETNNWQYDFKDVPKYDAQGVLYEYDVVEDVPNGYEHQRELIKAGNSYTVQMTNTFIENETTEIEGVKVWDDYDNKFNTRPSSVTIQLFADGKYQESQVISENPLTPESDWSYQFTNLDKYTTEGTLIEYTVKEVMLTTLVTPLIALNTEYTPEIVDNDYIINHYTNEQKVQFKGIKTWQYDQNVLENRPEKLVISLVRDGRLVVDTVMTSEEVNWQYSFTNNGEGYLVYRPDGTPYHYTIREEAIDSEGNVVQTLENYRPEIKVIGNTEVDEEVEINLTNSYNHTETTELKGSKTWLDANDKLGERPDKLRVTLYANDLATENTVEMTEETGWTYEFTELPVYDNKGDKISYRVEEEKVAGYEEIQGAPHFVNYLSKLDDKTSIKGVKKWNDQDDKLGNRPDEITVVLLRNGVPVVKNNKVVLAKVTAKSGWTYEFNDLPKYDSHANEYKYSVKEINVPNYVTTVDGTDLINTYHSSEVIEINGSKRWIDKDDKLGNRPSEIFVELYQTTADNPEITENQSPYRMTKVTEEDNWNYSFKELPKYDQNLDEYIYIVKEHKVANYNSKVDGYDITNIFDNSVTTEVNGKKIWKDNDDLFGVRPKSIQVDLYQNGGKTPMDTLEVTPGEDGDWNYSFKDLPKYDEDLNEYVYTVKEQDVSIFYESKVEGYDITNTYIDRAVVKRHVRKVWDDNDNQDNIRPDSIKVGLYQESKSTNKKSKKLYMEKVIVPNEQGVWETTFEHLPKYDEYNQEYVYTVVEDVVDKYDPTVVVAGGNAVITNHTKDGELTEVSGKKIWEDNNDQLGLRPDKIIVDLYQTASPKPREKQTPFATVEVTAEDNWEYFFTELPKYDEHGNECMYRVEERPVAKYDTIVEGYTIINKVNPYKPVDPEDPDPEKPVEPKDPEEPKKPEPLQPTTPSKENPTTNPKGSFLPKTGEATNGSWLGTLTGLTIISILGMVGYRRRKEDI
ncbi:Cna B-type domain-containing protein [uncultured Vagococcus sp.]|uniref:Cna B-type domain-containing protein n=1 Tax=uncultured Vagococcus sp. TaxID=189676 RepID=UPI0025854106|nr:Cna B-type domain-containing protein [uncultured Vagococcus sp.]